MSNLQRLIREVNKLSFSDLNLSVLLEMDKYGAFGEGINIFLEENRFTKEVYSSRQGTDRLITKLLTSYVLEMYIAFSTGDRQLYIDKPYWMSKQPKYNPKMHLLTSIIFNFYNDFHPKKNLLLGSIATLLLPITYEQIDLQDGYENHFNRFFAIYGSNTEINQLYKDKYNISLKRYMALSWGLFAYVFKKNKFSTSDFIEFMRSTIATHEEINTFLNLISLTREEFKHRYEIFRKHDDGTYLDWTDREAVDKALPRISYFYPLIRDGKTYSLISYTAIQEFLKFKGLYRSMTEGLRDLHFKQRYSGPLFEDYVRQLALKYNMTNKLHANIYGDEKYNISKGKEKREPDTIIETDEYIVMIECKTSPFSLNLVKYLDAYHLHILQKSIEKSVKNFDTFLTYRAKNTVGKKMTKIIVFYEGIHMAFTMLKSEIENLSNKTDVFVMDIESLELLLSEYTQPIPNILDCFLASEKLDSINLNGYIRSTLKNQAIFAEENEILHNIVQEELGLAIAEH